MIFLLQKGITVPFSGPQLLYIFHAILDEYMLLVHLHCQASKKNKQTNKQKSFNYGFTILLIFTYLF